MTNSFPTPGRGAWTQTGGLLPAHPTAKGKAGFYRLAGVGEKPIGSAYATGADTGHDAYVVHLAVKALQQLLGMPATQVDGWYGPKTNVAVFKAQVKAKIESDGVVGRATMRALLSPVVTEIALNNKVPVGILGGLLVNESGLDPAAVGSNGVDHGVAQINLNAHPTTSIEESLDIDYALLFAAGDLSSVHDKWVGETDADPWDIAIANHNSPRLAVQWARTGKAPFVEDRAFQIETYVKRVRAAW